MFDNYQNFCKFCRIKAKALHFIYAKKLKIIQIQEKKAFGVSLRTVAPRNKESTFL